MTRFSFRMTFRSVAGLIAALAGASLWSWYIWYLCRPGFSVWQTVGVIALSHLIIGFYMAWINLPGACCYKVAHVVRKDKEGGHYEC